MGSYKIDLRFGGGLTPAVREAFAGAAAHIERVIVEDLPSSPVGNERTTGLILTAQGRYIDGGGGILGMAGPTLLRASNLGRHSYLPSAGSMDFDATDLDRMRSDGTLLPVITHEMLHCVHVGTIWGQKGRVKTDADGSNPRFLGPRAAAAYTALLPYGTRLSAVPVEDQGGPGTRGAHWRERSLTNELMTGYVSPPGAPNPLSAITVGSCADCGYTVDYGAAEPFQLLSHVDSMLREKPVERLHSRALPPPDVTPDA